MSDPLSRRRTHSLLLLEKLLSPKQGVSPLTLLLDSLEQSSRPLVREIILRAKANKTIVIYLAYDTIQPPSGVDAFIKGRSKDARALQTAIAAAPIQGQPTILLIDSMRPLIALSASSSMPLPALLASLTPSPATTIVAAFHTDVPLPSPIPSASYIPSPTTLLRFLATTLITLHALPHALAAHRAAARSLPAPFFGLNEGVEGLLVGLGTNGGERGWARASEDLDVPVGMERGIVLEIEHRRKSGRGVSEMYFLPTGGVSNGAGGKSRAPAKAMILDDHPLFAAPKYEGDEGDPMKEATTFNLGLTEQQRKDREGVVLPYFDAQKGGGGPGDGGRILYQMGVEDVGDWDSEEDEL